MRYDATFQLPNHSAGSIPARHIRHVVFRKPAIQNTAQVFHTIAAFLGSWHDLDEVAGTTFLLACSRPQACILFLLYLLGLVGMGSLYEPSVRGSTISVIGRRISQRFTTLEGWREIGFGVYAMGSSNIRMFSIRHQFDPELSQNTDFDFTQTRDSERAVQATLAGRQSSSQRPTLSDGTIGKAIGSIRDGKSTSVFMTEERVQEPYHLYTVKEKWVLLGIVGAAACLPTFTFNAYLPALGKIATVGSSPYTLRAATDSG